MKKQHTNSFFIIATLIFLTSFILALPAEAKKKTKKPKGTVYAQYNLHQVKKKYYCGYNEKKSTWQIGIYQSKSEKFSKLGAWISYYRKTDNDKKIKSLKNKKKKYGKTCKQLSAPSPTATPNTTPTATPAPPSISGLEDFPSIASIFSSSTAASYIAPDVSGTPPALLDITDPTDVFWRSGVVSRLKNGTQTTDDCEEFLGSSIAGRSGGLNSCDLVEAFGVPVAVLIQGSIPFCYMRGFPTETNWNTGAITLLSGSFPENDFTKLFVPDSTNNKVIKINIVDVSEGRDDTFFIRLYSIANNALNSKLYQVDIWYCESGNTSDAMGYITVSVSSAGELEYISTGSHGLGDHLVELDGTLASVNDAVVFNPSQAKTLDFVLEDSGGGYPLKASMSMTQGSQMAVKLYDQGSGGNILSYSVSAFSASDLTDFRFLEGAYKENDSGSASSVATEYKDTFYAVPESSSYESSLNNVDFTTDSFYTSAPSLSIDTSAYQCSSSADISVKVDASNSVLNKWSDDCEFQLVEGGSPINRMQICTRHADVISASQKYYSECS